MSSFFYFKGGRWELKIPIPVKFQSTVNQTFIYFKNSNLFGDLATI